MPSNLSPAIYEIRIKGCLDERWLRWFEGLVITQCPEDETIIRGTMDQAALHGVLNCIRDLGIPLTSVQKIDIQDENHTGLNVSLPGDTSKKDLSQ